MLPRVNSYNELLAQFRWEIPERYNIGVDVCDRHAVDALLAGTGCEKLFARG